MKVRPVAVVNCENESAQADVLLEQIDFLVGKLRSLLAAEVQDR